MHSISRAPNVVVCQSHCQSHLPHTGVSRGVGLRHFRWCVSATFAMQKYKKIKEVGKGAFGAAILVQSRVNPKAQYVIKLVDVSKLKPKDREETKKEVKLLAAFNHPNIVRYRDSFLESGHLHIVMDFCDGGDLANLLKEQGTRHLPEVQVLDYFVQISLAMKHVHDRKILHRDIKSQNV